MNLLVYLGMRGRKGGRSAPPVAVVTTETAADIPTEMAAEGSSQRAEVQAGADQLSRPCRSSNLVVWFGLLATLP